MRPWPHVDRRKHSGHDTLGGEAFQPAARSRLCSPLREDRFQYLEHANAALRNPRPGCEIHKPGQSDFGLIFQELQQGPESGAELLRPSVLTFIGRGHAAREPAKALLERRQEAVVAVFEVPVEGFAWNTGAADDERHRHSLIAMLRHDFERSCDYPRAERLGCMHITGPRGL
jgi:hypothetical protein